MVEWIICIIVSGHNVKAISSRHDTQLATYFLHDKELQACKGIRDTEDTSYLCPSFKAIVSLLKTRPFHRIFRGLMRTSAQLLLESNCCDQFMCLVICARSALLDESSKLNRSYNWMRLWQLFFFFSRKAEEQSVPLMHGMSQRQPQDVIQRRGNESWLSYYLSYRHI